MTVICFVITKINQNNELTVSTLSRKAHSQYTYYIVMFTCRITYTNDVSVWVGAGFKCAGLGVRLSVRVCERAGMCGWVLS